MLLTRFIFIALCFIQLPAHAGGQYLEPDAFISLAFPQSQTKSQPKAHPKAHPKAKALWLTKADRENISDILAHKFRKLRLRYWIEDNKTAWILEEIGKEKPITIGVVINQGKIEMIKVLAFRESRGDEIRHDFFTKQFLQATLKNEIQLDRHIDGISGATLSVRAITKIARIALYLDQQLRIKRNNTSS